jgi:hypothetical protein
MSSDFGNQSENPGDLRHVEQTLAALSPRPPQVDRDRLMFLAGAAAIGQEPGAGGQWPAIVVRRNAWLWPTATAALGATSLALAVALVVRSAAPPQVVYVERPKAESAPAAMSPQIVKPDETPRPESVATNTADAPQFPTRAVAAPQVPADNYLRSREVALRMGIEALGSRRSAAGDSTPSMTYLDWLGGLGGTTSSAQPGESPAGSLPQM